MTTQVYLINNLDSALATATTVSPDLSAADWGVNNTQLPPLLHQPVWWMNRDEGITDGHTWLFTSTLTLGNVAVQLQAQLTGTFAGSTILIRIGAGGNSTPWSGDANVSLDFVGQDNRHYSITGTYQGQGLGYDNVQFSIGQRALAQIDHVIVMMMENRSFDNVLGYLYSPTHPPALNIPPAANADFRGLAYSPASNTAPGVNGGKPLAAWCGASGWTVPTPDPGEEFDHVSAQVANNMGGFLKDYASLPSTPTDTGQIMQSYSPAQLPVLSKLARAFAVSDAWHASVPSQTWPNRSFLLTGSSFGQVNNDHWPWKLTTVFDVLGSQNIDWKVYNAGTLPSLVKTLFAENYFDNTHNFGKLDEFQHAVSQGTLPPLTFLEPSFGLSENLGHDRSYHPPYDVRPAELLLAQVYEMIASSPKVDRTLFVLLFDEHGGTFDHVQPPCGAQPPLPYATAPTGGQPFAFDRFGVRVPAIVMSSYTPEGAVFRSATGVPFDHTSVLATVRDWLGLQTAFKQQLPSPRIAAAPTLAPVLPLTQPRPWPSLKAEIAQLQAAVAGLAAQPMPDATPLHDQQRAVLMMANIEASGRAPRPQDWQAAKAQLRTLGDARRLHPALAPFLPKQ